MTQNHAHAKASKASHHAGTPKKKHTESHRAKHAATAAPAPLPAATTLPPAQTPPVATPIATPTPATPPASAFPVAATTPAPTPAPVAQTTPVDKQGRMATFLSGFGRKKPAASVAPAATPGPSAPAPQTTPAATTPPITSKPVVTPATGAPLPAVQTPNKEEPLQKAETPHPAPAAPATPVPKKGGLGSLFTGFGKKKPVTPPAATAAPTTPTVTTPMAPVAAPQGASLPTKAVDAPKESTTVATDAKKTEATKVAPTVTELPKQPAATATPAPAPKKRGRFAFLFEPIGKKKPAVAPTAPQATAASGAPAKNDTPVAASGVTATPAPAGEKMMMMPGLKLTATKKEAAKKEAPKKDPTAPMVITGKMAMKKRGFGSFLASINNIGLGKEKTHFIENLAILLNSGLSVIEAIRTIEMEVRVKPMKKILRRIVEEVESGIALWRSMDNQNFFSPYALALIRIGEEAGSLSKNMEYLAAQEEKSRSLRSKVKSAMIYPSIVLILTLTITLGLAWFVLPQLVGVLIALNAELPLVTRVIIAVANYFRDNGKVAVPAVFGVVLMIFLLCKYTALRGPSQMLVFKFPGIGTMAQSATLAQFGVILGSLLRAGVPLVDAIRSMAEVTDTVYYKRFYFRLADEVEVGASFGKAFEKLKESKKLIPISVQQLVITGERSGKVSDMLMRVADIYEKKAEEAAQRLPVVLEPMLLLFMGGLVGTIAYGIIVPIYSVVGNVGH